MNFWSKLKPNVLLVSLIVGFLVLMFGAWLVPELTDKVSNEILALLIGVGIGGLIGIAGTLASDGPPDHLGKSLELLAKRDDALIERLVKAEVAARMATNHPPAAE